MVKSVLWRFRKKVRLVLTANDEPKLNTQEYMEVLNHLQFLLDGGYIDEGRKDEVKQKLMKKKYEEKLLKEKIDGLERKNVGK